MKNWTIKKRIIAGFATILGLVGLLTVTSFLLLRQAKDAAHFMTVDAMPGMEAMSQIKGLVGEIQLNVLRDLLSQVPEEHKRYRDIIAATRDSILKLMDDYEKSITTSEDRVLFEKLKVARDHYVEVRNQMLDLIAAGKMDQVAQLNSSGVSPAFLIYDQSVDQELALNLRNGNQETEQTVKATDRAMAFILVISICVLILGFVIATIITGSLNQVLRLLASSLNDGSAQVSAASSQVSAASQTLAEGSSEQASSLEETSSSLEEMSSMTKRNSENARKANELAKEARTAADKGVGDMANMNTAMEAIKTSSDDIAKIIKTIDEIAFQTNILALNAAVEAARAGEAGMGFAVVADEVRNLAQRCAQAAKETAGKIEGAILKTGQGVDISGKVAAALNEIVTKVRQVDELVTEVAGASREQTDGIAQINVAVGQMDKVTQSNAATAEESAAAAEELNSQAEVLKQSVAELLQLVGGRHTQATRMSERHSSESVLHHPTRKPVRALPESKPAGVASWNEETMATGVATVDAQHRELLNRINELHADCVAGKAREELMEHLNYLGRYAESHFAGEEKIMAEHKCPTRGQNQAAHRKFLQDYAQLVAMVQQNGASTKVALLVKQMLADWLTTHICRIDTGLRNCTASAPSGPAHRRAEIPMTGDFSEF